MFTRKSRYFDARRFAADEQGQLPFKGVRPRVIGPATPVLEHALQPDERLDALGVNYYNDARLWWRILDANADVLCAAQLEMIGLPPLPRRPGDPATPPSGSPQATQQEQDFGEVLLIPRANEGQS